MKEAEFREWLQANGANTEAGRNTRVHAIKTIERKLSELGSPFTTLADAWSNDRFQQLRERIRRMRQNAREGDQDFRILMPESQKPSDRLSNWNSWLAQYGRFLAGEQNGHMKDADRIRQYVLEHYIEAAREAEHDSVEVLVSDVNRALGLNQAWPNICQALAGKMFQELADVPAPERIGADQSSATVFRFRLGEAALDWAEKELRSRYSKPIVDTDKMIGFAVRDGRQVALQRDVNGTQLWIEDPGQHAGLPIKSVRRYTAEQARHSNLPVRLKHRQSRRNEPRPVALVTVGNLDELRSVLDWYEREHAINRKALEGLRQRFEDAFPDFRTFDDTSSGFHRQEDDYKRALIQRVQDALATDSGDIVALGRAVLDLVLDRSTNLIGNWRTYDHLIAVRQSNPDVFDQAAGILVSGVDDPGSAVETFLRATWPLISAGQDTNMPYGDSRILPTLILALARPRDAIALRYQPFNNASLMLLGRSAFANAPLSPSEYEDMIALARAVEGVMRNEWGWKPRDLWDVQGFVWVTCQKRLTADDLDASVEPSGEVTVPTTNLILYGPPGTGKTYATAEEALKLCGEEVPGDREELMSAYRRLAEAGRIEFVTFHQSYAYEEFVEGLRPVQQEEHSAGFHLEAEAGVLRRVARRAETSTGSGGPAFAIGDRQVFKMSIGEAANPDDAHLFEEAIEGGYTLLGFEDIDWSDEQFTNRAAIIEAVKARGVIGGGEPNAMSGRVQMPFIFRNWVRPGDIIVVSKGNGLFRAIGEVTGEYQFVPREGGDYGHRRSVRWLWVDRTGVPVSEIYTRNFTMKSIYLLARSDLNIPALERYIASQQSAGAGAPQSFVLIIDEINRANVSKVMGELITLLEPDKRIGATNELRIRLPYSRDMFGLPPNLHMIGTMNTADRSIALLDTALRRRFKFREVAPEPQLLAEAAEASGLPLVAFLSTINDRIEYLLDREHRIGHAYFINCRSRFEVDAAMRNAIIPLLQEYFFEDLSRVAVVLGEPKGGGFLSCRQIKDPLGEGDARDSWIVLPEFAENAYDRCLKPDTPIHLAEAAE